MTQRDPLDELNPRQREAVAHTEGPLLILAGAGSGKTRVITYRIAHLIKAKRVPPFEIFAVTFTNKAADEMKRRVAELIGPTGESVFVRTFHSAAVYILRRYGDRVGVPRAFSIYDQKDQETLVKDILMEMRLDPKKIRPAALVSKISEIKDRAEMIDGADLSHLMPAYPGLDFHDLYREYQARLERSGALDFNDLLIKTVLLMRHSPESLADLQRRWRYFMIDEYQDTNHAQYLICKYLSSVTRNLCVVGDDDQSIYSWRGADIRNILEFERDFDETKVVTLEENYRSTVPILDAAWSVIRNNVNRKEKRLHAVRGDGEPVTWCRANNEYGEAEYVVSTIMSLKKREALTNRDFAIFYRTNAQSRVFEEMLRRENMPYRVVGGLKFYDRKEIKDILAYLRLIANPTDGVALLRVINVPARGIGAATVERLRDTAYTEEISEWELIARGFAVKGRVPAGIVSFKTIIERGMAAASMVPDSMKLSAMVRDLIDATSYRQALEEESSVESRSRLENIEEFVNSVYEYEARNPDAGLDRFLQEISLLTSEESPDAGEGDPSNSITLMTVHNAKGLEFPVVFLTGMEEGIFPHFNSSDTEAGIEEERRLCYVGITRAMDRIFLTSAEMRRSYSGLSYKEPSHFVAEIPAGSLDVRQYGEGGYSAPVRERLVFQPTESAPPARAGGESRPTGNGSRFKTREVVLHPKYGRGRILSVEGSGDNVKLTIVFGNGDRKTFLEKYTPLEKV
jgi:DNA helicase-2/ATP-dependent DNA helicase PcrA